MNQNVIEIKQVRQGVFISLSSFFDFEEVVKNLRISLEDCDFGDASQAILDLGGQDISKMDFSVLESIFFEYGLFLKRILSRPELPEVLKGVESNSRKNSLMNKERKKMRRTLVKKPNDFQEENLAAEVIRMDSPNTTVNGLKNRNISEVKGASSKNDFSKFFDVIDCVEDKRYISEINNLQDMRERKLNGSFNMNKIKGTEDQPNTLLIQRSLRSGQSIQYSGNVVIMGDVNPGAEVIASGNIVVMGFFKGVAHAGATGDENATITAFRLQPTQLRIAGHITRPPDEEMATPKIPEIARIKDGMVVIEKY